MSINLTINDRQQELVCRLGDNVQTLLHKAGFHSVRNSDDGFGFAGSDVILVDGRLLNASLLIAAQLEGTKIYTAESLGKWNQLNHVQQAMIDVGVVQSGYNDPAMALILTELLKHNPNQIVTR